MGSTPEPRQPADEPAPAAVTDEPEPAPDPSAPLSPERLDRALDRLRERIPPATES